MSEHFLSKVLDGLEDSTISLLIEQFKDIKKIEHLDFIEDQDLKEIGITQRPQRKVILYTIQEYKNKHNQKKNSDNNNNNNNNNENNIDEEENSNNEVIENKTDILNFMKILYQLKEKKRTGWVLRNVNLPESISDHMYAMALMCFLVKDEELDKEKMIKLCLIHDISECICKDFTPLDNLTEEEKYQIELDAVNELLSNLDKETAKKIKVLWDEYESRESKESKIVKDIDRFEMIFQASFYEEEQKIDLEDFFNHTKNKIIHPEIQEWDRMLREKQKSNNRSY